MYAIFGVTRQSARMRAERQVKKHHANGTRKTIEEMEQEFSESADTIFDNMEPEQLTLEYDSLKMALDYIRCTKNTPARTVHIREKRGNTWKTI